MSDGKYVRERVREVLVLLSSLQLQRAYQTRAPAVNVAEELFNQWDDWYRPDNPQFGALFTVDEIRALGEFSKIIDAIAEETPQVLPPLEEFTQTDAWRRLCAEAQKALGVLAIQGPSD
ncbi:MULTISPECIES: hypothetical protein [unclassified Sorangium]|uniref:hypothetical protein n=1 Tax=unclassified Sorangium TaxID=2621164 RepID=UPI003F5DBE5A